MKKIILILMMVSFFVGLSGCTPGSSSGSFSSYYDKLVEYQSKLQSLINDADVANTTSHTRALATLDESKMYMKEDFMAVYLSQPGFHPDINRTEFLYAYKGLIDDVVDKLDELGVIKLDVYVDIQFEGYGDVSIYCGYASDEGVIIKLQYDRDEMTILTAFKTGYLDDVFFVNQIDYYKDGSELNYNYSEFVEGETYVEIQYRGDGDFLYTSHGLLTNEEFTLQKSVEGLEGESGPYGGYTVSWFNTETRVRNHLGFDLDNELFQEMYEVFNDHSILFEYFDYDLTSPEVKVAWNMLEASGWDYVYVEDIEQSNPQPTDGIYKDGVHLFEGDQLNVDKSANNSNLRIGKDFNLGELTQAELDLTAYGLTFSMNLTFDTIDQMREDALSATDAFANYKGVDFFGGNISAEFLNIVDDDLQFDLEF